MFCEHKSAHFRLISAFVVVIKKTMLKKHISKDRCSWMGWKYMARGMLRPLIKITGETPEVRSDKRKPRKIKEEKERKERKREREERKK